MKKIFLILSILMAAFSVHAQKFHLDLFAGAPITRAIYRINAILFTKPILQAVLVFLMILRQFFCKNRCAFWKNFCR